MWVYYEDKGKHIGMTASRHTALRNFIHNAEAENEVLSFMENVKLPTLERRMKLKVMFDIPSFTHRFNLDCLNCGETHVYGSCWGAKSCYRHCIDDNLNEKIEASGYDEYYSQIKCDKSKYFKTDGYTEAHKLYKSEIEYLLGSECLRRFENYFGGED